MLGQKKEYKYAIIKDGDVYKVKREPSKHFLKQTFGTLSEARAYIQKLVQDRNKDNDSRKKD